MKIIKKTTHWKFIKTIIFIFILLISIHFSFLLFYWLSEKLEKSDLIVVFWNKIELNWEPSDRLKTRLNKALQLYKNGYSNKILVSWWLWKEWFKEGSVMKDYLEKLWVKKNDIIVDNEWNNT